MTALLESQTRPAQTAASLARCLACGARLLGRDECPDCGGAYPVDDGILQAIGPLSGSNRIAAAFYDGPTWPRFKFWEQVFLALQGPGTARARRQVLRYLPDVSTARVLEVGIGDGENLPLLPPGWEVFGVDIARSRLSACRDRFPAMSDRLVWAEGEGLPFENGSFDAVFTIGGINYFRDSAMALREMRRVARPGGVVIAADENPDLFRFGLGHMLGVEAFDRWWLGLTGLDEDFVAMVLDTPPVVELAARHIWPRHRRVPIWNRLGYCLVETLES